MDTCSQTGYGKGCSSELVWGPRPVVGDIDKMYIDNNNNLWRYLLVGGWQPINAGGSVQLDDIFIPITEQELVNNATTLGVIDLYEKYYVKSISCPNLVSCDLINIFQLYLPLLKLEELNLPFVETINYISISSSNITYLVLPALLNSNSINISYSNLLLETVDIPSLLNVESLNIVANPLLAVIGISSSLNCLNIDFSGNALTEYCVDNILVKIDAAGYEDGVLVLTGGTIAIPSALGLGSKTSLEGKGWTVSVNS